MDLDDVDIAGMSTMEVMAARQDATERALTELARAVKQLSAQLAELKAGRSAQNQGVEIGSIVAAADEEPVTPEMAAVIAAAATAFVDMSGSHGSIKGARSVPDTAKAWSQQGRVVVQTSHNFRSRG